MYYIIINRNAHAPFSQLAISKSRWMIYRDTDMASVVAHFLVAYRTSTVEL